PVSHRPALLCRTVVFSTVLLPAKLVVFDPHRAGRGPVPTRSLYPTTSIPIDLAVPRTLLVAASTEAAFRSGILCLAMSSTCFAVTLPTLSLFGVPDPLAIPAARLSKTEAGGVFVMNVNERSL